MTAGTKTPSAVSLWDFSAAESPVDAPLSGDIDTDLAVVGGGFTGLSTALHAARKGIDCHVLEARKVGYGGSGRNVGLVNAALWLPPQDVRERLGPVFGPRFVARFGEAPEYVFSLIEQYGIDCELTHTGTIHAAHAPSGFDDLRRRAEEWDRLGAPVTLLDRQQAAEKIGSDVFHGGLLDHRAGTVNPMGYVRGLARAALVEGAGISTGSPVLSIRREGGDWILQCPSGRVRAAAVVLGTNAYTDDIWPGLKKCFTMIHYFQIATAPMPERVANILPGRHGLWDTGRIMFNVRRDAHGRVLLGSMGRSFGGERGLTRRWAQKQLNRMFPELGTVDFDVAWHGQIAMTPDHLPRVYELAPKLYTAIGYNGRGITTGTIFGEALSELIDGGDPADLPLPVTKYSTASRRGLNSRLFAMAFTANQIWQSL